MKTFFLAFIVFVSSAGFASSQVIRADSLLSALTQHAETDIKRVDLLNSLAFELYAIDLEKSLVYATEAAEISNNIKYTEGKAEAVRLIGRYYLTLSDYTEAERHFNEALLLFEETGDQRGLYRTLNNIGIVHYHRGDLSRSFDYYQRSLVIAHEIGDNSGISAAYNNLGLIHFQQENFPEALDYMFRSLELLLGGDNLTEISRRYNNIGSTYERSENYGEALNYFNRALDLREEINDVRGSAATLHNIGNLYLAMGDNDKAAENLEKALLLSVEARTPALEGNCRNALASLYLKTNQFNKALPYASEAYRLAVETGDADLIRRSAENLSACYAALGDYKEAFEYHVVYKTMSDSILSETSIKRITSRELEYKYETEREMVRLEQVAREAVLQAELNREQSLRNYSLIGFLSIVVLSLLLYYNMVQKRRRNHLLAEKNRHIELMNSSLVQLNADKDRFMQILAHDLRSPFTSILGFSELLKENLDSYDTGEISVMVDTIHSNLIRAYQLVDDLLLWANSQAGKLPFEPAPIKLPELSQEITEAQRDKARVKGIKINNHIEGDINLFADGNMVRTILRNLLSNAIKFTDNGGTIDISATIAGNEIEIQISDTGRGMNDVELSKLWDIKSNYSTEGTAGEKGSGLGLLICREFVEKHDCKIWVESEPGRGSDFIFTMPMYKA